MKKYNTMTKTINHLLILALCLVQFTGIQAQDDKSTEILDKLSRKMKSIPSYSATFTNKIEDKQADMESTQSGSIKVAGDKFELTFGDLVILSDGITVWSYSSSDNEVMISDIEDTFDEGINPTKIFTLWEEGFKSSYAGQEEVDEVLCDKIKLFPTDPADKDYHTILLFVKSDALEVSTVKILGKDGTDVTYNLENFSKEHYPAIDFRFDKSKHPGVEVIDNR